MFTASGHPGFPTDSMLVENNHFYSNNFNTYAEDSDVEPTVPFPIGVGAWIAGGNNHTFRNNHFWDNWQRGIMTFSVPDAFVCGEQPPANGNRQAGCDEKKVSTSHRNRFYGNVMGRDPAGNRDPNGTDFWWDQFPGNRNNCWYGNTGKDGTQNSITSAPPAPLLPSNCETSVGTGNPAHENELLTCFAEFTAEDEAGTPKRNACPWCRTPPEPR